MVNGTWASELRTRSVPPGSRTLYHGLVSLIARLYLLDIVSHGDLFFHAITSCPCRSCNLRSGCRQHPRSFAALYV